MQSSWEVYMTLVRQQARLYASMIQALPQHAFFIVGDHAPKFFDGNDGKFEPNTVPYFFVPACAARSAP
jgi:hypothetical protein